MNPSLSLFLQQLNSSYSSASVRDAIETLLKIHRNIYFNKKDTKYIKLQLHNETFCRKVWNVAPAQQFMLQCGWTLVDDALSFTNDRDLPNIINILLEHRYVQPKNNEWNTETKIENLNTSKQHEEMLRAKAAEKRRKELEEFKKDKMYREQLAQKVKQQIAEDRERRHLLHPKPIAVLKKMKMDERDSVMPKIAIMPKMAVTPKTSWHISQSSISSDLPAAGTSIDGRNYERDSVMPKIAIMPKMAVTPKTSWHISQSSISSDLPTAGTSIDGRDYDNSMVQGSKHQGLKRKRNAAEFDVQKIKNIYQTESIQLEKYKNKMQIVEIIIRKMEEINMLLAQIEMQ